MYTLTPPLQLGNAEVYEIISIIIVIIITIIITTITISIVIIVIVIISIIRIPEIGHRAAENLEWVAFVCLGARYQQFSVGSPSARALLLLLSKHKATFDLRSLSGTECNLSNLNENPGPSKSLMKHTVVDYHALLPG